jgi:hypothetical protein
MPVAHMMPYFVLAGIFKKDDPKGIAIKSLLRKLDSKQKLSLIPFAQAVKINIRTRWFFVRVAYKPMVEVSKTRKKKILNKEPFKKSDAFYVIDLCKKVLNAKLETEKKINFRNVNASANPAFSELKVAGFFETYKLAINYMDKASYNLSKSVILNEAFGAKGFQFLNITYKKFAHFSTGKLKRNTTADLEVIRHLLAPFYSKTTLF